MQSFKNHLSLDPLAETVDKINSIQNNSPSLPSISDSASQETRTKCCKLIKLATKNPLATLAISNNQNNNNRATVPATSSREDNANSNRFLRCFQTPEFNLNTTTTTTTSSFNSSLQQREPYENKGEPIDILAITATDKYGQNGIIDRLAARNNNKTFTKVIFLKEWKRVKSKEEEEEEERPTRNHKQKKIKLKEFKPSLKRIRKLQLYSSFLLAVEAASNQQLNEGGSSLKRSQQPQQQIKQYKSLASGSSSNSDPSNNHKLKIDSRICALDRDNELNILQQFYAKPTESKYTETRTRKRSGSVSSCSSSSELRLLPIINRKNLPKSAASLSNDGNPSNPRNYYKLKPHKKQCKESKLRLTNTRVKGSSFTEKDIDGKEIADHDNNDDAFFMLKSQADEFDGLNTNPNIYRNFGATPTQQQQQQKRKVNFFSEKNLTHKEIGNTNHNHNATEKKNTLIIKPILKGKIASSTNHNSSEKKSGWEEGEDIEQQHNNHNIASTKKATRYCNYKEALLIEKERVNYQEEEEAFSLPIDPERFILRANSINNNYTGENNNINNYRERCVNFERNTNCLAEERSEKADLLKNNQLPILHSTANITTSTESQSQITTASSSMKRSKMNMNLAGLGPEKNAQESVVQQQQQQQQQIYDENKLKDHQYLADTISSAKKQQNETTTKTTSTTTRKTTHKLVPSSELVEKNNNNNQLTSNTNNTSHPKPPQPPVTHNTSSVFSHSDNISDPNNINIKSNPLNITTTSTVDGRLITTEKSSNYNRTYEKHQRVLDQQHPAKDSHPKLDPLPKLQSILVKTPRTKDTFRYIDDDDEYQCHDDTPSYERIVPQRSSSASNTFRSGLKESINQLDRLIDSEQQKQSQQQPAKLVYPKIEPQQPRSSSAQNRNKPEQEQFHPTWDEWKREQNTSNSVNSSLGLKFDTTATSVKKQSVNNNETSELQKTTKRSVIEESYRQDSNSSNKQEYQVNKDTSNTKQSNQVELMLNDKRQNTAHEIEQRATLVINNADTTNMKNQVKLNIGNNNNSPAPPQRSFDSRKFHKQNSVDLYANDSQSYVTSSTKKSDLRKQSLTKRLEEIFYNQVTENTIPITPITQSNFNIKQILSKPQNRTPDSPRSPVPTFGKQTVSPTKVLNTPRHPVYPIDRKPVRAASPVQYSSATLAKEEPMALPIVQRAMTPQPELPQPKKIQKTILSTKRRDSAPNFTGWRDDESMPALVRQQSGAIPIEYISIRLDPKPQEVKEPVKKSITTGTNTNVERGKKIASTNTNQDELPQYNLHVSLDSLFVKQRREASTETEVRNQACAATETDTRHKDAFTVTDDEGEPPQVNEQYLFRSHNSRYAAWETQSNPPQEDYRLEFLAKSPRTIHRKHTCEHSHHCCSSEDIYGFNQICNQACYRPITYDCRADDDDILIFGNQGANHYREESHHHHHHSHVRTGSIPNLCYVPVVPSAPVVRRFVRTTTTCGAPVVNQQQQHQNGYVETTSTTNIQDAEQISSIQSKFDEIFGVQRQNDCYSSHSLGIMDAPKTERYFKTTRTTNAQVPSFGEIYEQRRQHNAVQTSSSSTHHKSSSINQQQYQRPLVEMPATPDSTMRHQQQQLLNSSSQVGGSNYGGSSGYSSYNHRASHNESYTNGQPDYIRQLNFTDSHKGGVDHLSSSSRAFQGGRYEEHNEEHILPSTNNNLIHSDVDNVSENRQFRPIFHPVHTESSSSNQQSKWPSSARDY